MARDTSCRDMISSARRRLEALEAERQDLEQLLEIIERRWPETAADMAESEKPHQEPVAATKPARRKVDARTEASKPAKRSLGGATSEASVLAALKGSKTGALGVVSLAPKLGLNHRDKKVTESIRQALKRLEAAGKVRRARGGRWALPDYQEPPEGSTRAPRAGSLPARVLEVLKGSKTGMSPWDVLRKLNLPESGDRHVRQALQRLGARGLAVKVEVEGNKWAPPGTVDVPVGEVLGDKRPIAKKSPAKMAPAPAGGNGLTDRVRAHFNANKAIPHTAQGVAKAIGEGLDKSAVANVRQTITRLIAQKELKRVSNGLYKAVVQA